MATSPIVVVWASTTSNKDTLDTTTQGNGIIFESDIVSDFINSALYINSQATRNLQVMGGYFDAGQEYKNYQYCSQVLFDGTDYVLNYFMATQDNPSLAPTNASSFQIGTTDMQIPTNASSIQQGWKKINFLSNQENLVYSNKQTTFTNTVSFSGTTSFAGTASFDGGVNFLGSTTAQTPTLPTQVSTKGYVDDKFASLPSFSNIAYTDQQNTFSEPQACLQYLYVGRRDVYTQISSSGILSKGSERSSYWIASKSNYSSVFSLNTNTFSVPLARFSIYASFDTYVATTKQVEIVWQTNWSSGSYNRNSVYVESNPNVLIFTQSTTLKNCTLGTNVFALDPEWEQDYATANYVNQKLQELYDYLDARISTIEDKLGIPKVASLARGITPREAINEIAVPQSTIKQLFDRIEAMEGYEGVLGYSNAEERKEIAQVKNDESAVMQIVDKIKARKEQEEEEQRQREEQEKAELEAQNQK